MEKLNSVKFSHSVVSDPLPPLELQHARPPCPSSTLGVYLNSCPLSQWCHPTISSSVVPFSSCPQSFLASGSFQVSQLFTSGGQSIGASASKSVFPNNVQDWFPLEWAGLISLLYEGLSGVFFNTKVQKHQFFGAQPLLWSNSHIHTWLLEKNTALTIWTFVCKVMSLLFNTLSMLSWLFLPRNKPHLASFNFVAAVTMYSDFGAKKIKPVTVSTFSPSICHEVVI